MVLRLHYYELIRRTPRKLIEGAYLVLEAVDAIRLALHNPTGKQGMPLPPMRSRARVGSRSAVAFIEAGRSCAEALRNAAREHLQLDIAHAGRILDFGCGCGRTLRHFAPTAVDGCDVDARAIFWMQQNVERGEFLVNDFHPPLPWGEGTFDLVYSVSIFSHLNEQSQIAWLREIARVLRPGGAALLTVQSNHAFSMFLQDRIYSPASMKSRLARHRSVEQSGGFVFEPYASEAKRGLPGVTSDYGLTFHSRSYIERVWSEFFDLRGIDVGSVDGLQDVVALRKRPHP